MFTHSLVCFSCQMSTVIIIDRLLRCSLHLSHTHTFERFISPLLCQQACMALTTALLSKGPLQKKKKKIKINTKWFFSWFSLSLCYFSCSVSLWKKKQFYGFYVWCLKCLIFTFFIQTIDTPLPPLPPPPPPPCLKKHLSLLFTLSTHPLSIHKIPSTQNPPLSLWHKTDWGWLVLSWLLRSSTGHSSAGVGGGAGSRPGAR